jgi:threonine aldolase
MQPIDFRSDTVTRPSAEMRRIMASAEVGDDVFDDDPSINHLQDYAAELLDFEAALFAPTGTQANLIALLTHCQRGDEYLVGQDAHTYKYEGGGAAVLGSIQPQPISNQPDGSIALADITAAIKPDDFYFARTRLLALEDTIGGKVLPMDYLAAAEKLARGHGLGLHMDGARLFNASVKLGIDALQITRHFDSVSVCLSKGLGAPVGSLLLGSRDFIHAGRRWRKMLGGGMRQAGILAAAGEYALRNNVQRLAEDHANAALLASGLAQLPLLKVTLPQTNLVFVDVAADHAEKFAEHLASQNILVTGSTRQRWVTHLDVDRAQIETAVRVAHEYG